MTYTITCAAHEIATVYLDSATVIPALTVVLEESSHCTIILKGSQSVALALNLHLIGAHATCITKIALRLTDTARAQISTTQVHDAPDTTSDVLLKTVLTDTASCSYTGSIVITENARQSSAQQNSYALLMSPTAHMHAHPALEIHTHDVRCGHGAAVATLENEHLFYVQSRGLGKEHAEQLIIDSFLSIT